MKDLQKIFLLNVIITTLLGGCANIPEKTAPTTTAAAPVILTATMIGTPTIQTVIKCQQTFEHREMYEPYKRDVGNAPRYTLSIDELNAYFKLMSIENLCIPVEAGAPFLNVDWDSQTGKASKGRMISLGFENMYTGSGWSRIYLIHSTYDFSAGTEYDRFMSTEEWAAFQNGILEGVERLADSRGFIRYKIGLGYDTAPVYKAVVFPAETGYTALIFNLGTFSGDIDAQIARLKAGEVPESAREWMPIFDQMGETLRLQK